MIDHLWSGTAVALVAAALVLTLRDIPARIRFSLLLLAMLRFAIPTPWLTLAGQALAACLPSRVITIQTLPLEGLLHPGVFLGTNAPAAEPEALAILPILWLLGAFASAALWLRNYPTPVVAVREPLGDEQAALERAASRLNVVVPALMITAPGVTPGAIGLFRPIVLLPDGLSAELTADELESVCAHELAHIRRHDNLTAAVSRAITSAFWFHPLVWWMDRRMRSERELACDEMVVFNGSREAYATALSKVCLATASTRSLFAAMAGPHFAQRLEKIMSNTTPLTDRKFRLLPAAVALCALMLPIGAGFLVAQGPTSAGDSLFQSAYDCFNKKDYAQAEVLFRRMMTEYPADDRGLVGLAEVFTAQQRSDEALRLLRDAVAKNPSSFPHRMALGNLLVRQEQYKEALAEYDKAARLASTSAEAERLYAGIGETYRRMGRLQDGIAALWRAKDASGKASLQLAQLLDGTGDVAGAEREYRELIAQDPKHAVALNNLAYRLTEREGQLDEALALALRAQQAAPSSPDITDTVGWIYLKKRMPDPSTAAFIQALATAPENALYRQHLAAALDLKGDWTADRRELRTLLDTAKSAQQISRLKELLATP